MYKRMKGIKILNELSTEAKARQWVWEAKFGGKDFVCPNCQHESYYQHHKYPEIRECKECHFEVRLRANTIFQHSKIPVLIWLKTICLMSQGKRGISATELQSALEMPSYGTAWRILHKIREAMRQRDAIYKLNSIIELDGAVFGRKQTGNQAEVLVAIETKDWINSKGRRKSKAGFAKVIVSNETKKAQTKGSCDEVPKSTKFRFYKLFL